MLNCVGVLCSISVWDNKLSVMSFVCCACEMLFIVLYWLLEFTGRPPGMSKNALTSYELMFLLWTVTIILTIKLALSYYLLIYTRLRVTIAIGLYIYMVGGLLFEWNILCLFSELIDILLCNLNYKFRRVLYKNLSNMTIATNLRSTWQRQIQFSTIYTVAAFHTLYITSPYWRLYFPCLTC